MEDTLVESAPPSLSPPCILEKITHRDRRIRWLVIYQRNTYFQIRHQQNIYTVAVAPLRRTRSAKSMFWSFSSNYVARPGSSIYPWHAKYNEAETASPRPCSLNSPAAIKIELEFELARSRRELYTCIALWAGAGQARYVRSCVAVKAVAPARAHTTGPIKYCTRLSSCCIRSCQSCACIRECMVLVRACIEAYSNRCHRSGLLESTLRASQKSQLTTFLS